MRTRSIAKRSPGGKLSEAEPQGSGAEVEIVVELPRKAAIARGCNEPGRIEADRMLMDKTQVSGVETGPCSQANGVPGPSGERVGADQHRRTKA
jgi:hypothetical protein